ncbi:MAG TPA: hypothetical protein VGL56_15245 [Fimbriimonadaceae bacterium]|jgi:hypothetical protein
MKSTLFASFAKPADAERAAGALLDHGLKSQDISILAHEQYDEERRSSIAAAEQDRIRNEIEQNETTGSVIGHSAVNDFSNSTTQPQGVWSEPGSNIASGYGMAGGIESTDAATFYRSGDQPFIDDDGAPVFNPPTDTLPVDQAVVHDPTLIRHPVAAKSGITTTTAADAGSGAVKGLAAGIGVGILATLAAVFVPGIGMVIGGGALAAGVLGTAGAAGAGAIAGGVVGYLKDQGVPDDVLTVYHEAFDRGGAILAVALTSDTARSEVEAILAKYGAQNLDAYGEVAV